MATQGPRYPTTAVNTGVAPENTDAWTNPTNVGADDGAESTIVAASYDSPDISQRLRAAGFGFTIPTGATIDGITVEIERRSIIANSGKDFRVQLQDEAGALVGTNKAVPATIWPTTATIATYGGTADTWTASPTVAMVNDPDFGVVLSAQANIANADIGVDFIRVTITYTAPVIVSGAVAVNAVATVAPTAGLTLRSAVAAVANATAVVSARTILRSAVAATATATVAVAGGVGAVVTGAVSAVATATVATAGAVRYAAQVVASSQAVVAVAGAVKRASSVAVSAAATVAASARTILRSGAAVSATASVSVTPGGVQSGRSISISHAKAMSLNQLGKGSCTLG